MGPERRYPKKDIAALTIHLFSDTATPGPANRVG
jgi:hypothetical protein